MSKIRMYWVLVVLLGLSGCAWKEYARVPWLDKGNSGSAVEKSEKDINREVEAKVDSDIFTARKLSTDGFIRYYQELATLTPAAKESQLKKTRATYESTRDAKSGILYALTLISAGPDGSSQTKALAVLDELQDKIITSKTDTDITGFMHLLWDMVRTNNQLRNQNRALEKQLGTNQEQLSNLQKQISALKSIEKSIHDREVGAVSESR